MKPHHLDWDEEGKVPHALFHAAGQHGLLGFQAPEQYGGMGLADFRFNQILIEELMSAGVGSAGLNFSVHNDICLPYLHTLANDEQRRRWLPGFVSGERV